MFQIYMKNKKLIFISIFLICFIVISAIADVYYFDRVLHKEPDMKGWICYCDFLVFWIASHHLHYHILVLPNKKMAFTPFLLFNKKLREKAKPASAKDQHPVYDKKEEFYHFRYSPFAAFLMLPFGKTYYPSTAFAAWQVILNLLFLVCLILLKQLLQKDFALNDKYTYIILGAGFFATLRFYLLNIFHGQTNILITLLFVLFLLAYLKDKEILCGILFAFILQFKLFFLPMLVYFLIIGKRKLIISSVISFAGMLIVPASLLGLQKTIYLTQKWFEILNMSVTSQLLNYKNESLVYTIGRIFANNASFMKLVSPDKLFFALGAVFTLAAYIALFLFRRSLGNKKNTEYKYLELSLLLMASIIFSPIAWKAYFITLIIPFSVTLLLILKTPKTKRKIPFIALGVFVVSSGIIGTDLTKFIPRLNALPFQNISFGTCFLAFAAIYAYKQNLQSTKATCLDSKGCK
ncbi:MAG: glycosyltransferase family 87 protein [Candidatus Omnitrophota bacterium]